MSATKGRVTREHSWGAGAGEYGQCAIGEPHESPALTCTEGGRTKTLTLSASEIKEVRAALGRYTRAKTQFDHFASRGLQALQRRRVAFTSGLHAAFYASMVFMALAAVLSASRGRRG